ncbi:class I SAM-dependent methyltransferase [Mariniphaga sp.]|uniref:class I SAM-dependent methyltransferase n=1 Tax=Mariniphaga sp. TaxID=1954475 RepID=UPI0035663F10
MVESGFFYSTVIDPVLAGMRKRVNRVIPKGQNILDVACGTGAQVFELAPFAREVTGIDLSESMIRKAEQTKQKRKISNVLFRVCDATDNWKFTDKQFDIAIITMALHQFPPENYTSILGEMKRVAQKIIIVDYAVPLPQNITGWGSRVAEFFAGREHHRNFRQYYRAGGLKNILAENDLTIQHQVFLAKRAFQLVVCSQQNINTY